jgi:hypothetical protein
MAVIVHAISSESKVFIASFTVHLGAVAQALTDKCQSILLYLSLCVKHARLDFFQDLPKNVEKSWEVAKKPFNKEKNRYGNIVTCTPFYSSLFRCFLSPHYKNCLLSVSIICTSGNLFVFITL